MTHSLAYVLGNHPTNGVFSQYTPNVAAIGNSVITTALVGFIPLLAFFVLLGVFKIKTHWCAIISFILSCIIAIFGFSMPVGMVAMSATQGLALGLIPIVYIIIAAVWLYNLTEVSGRSDDLRAVFNMVGKGDIRVQSLIIAFSFCGLLEGLAGFGAPVAIVAAMLVTIGVKPIKAAVLTIIGNSLFVGFGAMSIPVTTAGKLGGVAPAYVGSLMGHFTPFLVTIMPFILLLLLDGLRGIRQLWPIAIVAGVGTSAGHFFTAMFSYELTSVAAALVGLVACYLFLLVWTPTVPTEFQSAAESSDAPKRDRVILALLPYVLVVVLIGFTKLWKLGVDIDAALKSTSVSIPWPGLHGKLLEPDGSVSGATIYKLSLLGNPGTWIFVAALIVAFIYSRTSSGGRFPITFGKGIATLFNTIYALRLSILTIAMVMALAYVMNFSGQTTSIGAALALAGAGFAFLSPMLGWVATAVAGSATSAGALFANLQTTAAQGAGLNPGILLAANTVGGGIGKIISLQNLTIAAGAVGEPGSEPELLRKAAPISVIMLLILCVLVFAASQGWMGIYIPPMPVQ